MSRFTATAAALALALLAACSTTPEPSPTATQAAERAPVSPAPRRADAARAASWAAERARLATALGGAPGIAVQVRDDGALQLLLPGADAFSRGDEEPRASLRSALDRVADALAPVTTTEIRIFGHTDSMASELYNLALSIRRAEKVAEYLRLRGIALARLRPDGRGESEPIADNATEAGRAQNRRVEILVRPSE